MGLRVVVRDRPLGGWIRCTLRGELGGSVLDEFGQCADRRSRRRRPLTPLSEEVLDLGEQVVPDLLLARRLGGRWGRGWPWRRGHRKLWRRRPEGWARLRLASQRAAQRVHPRGAAAPLLASRGRRPAARVRCERSPWRACWSVAAVARRTPARPWRACWSVAAEAGRAPTRPAPAPGGVGSWCAGSSRRRLADAVAAEPPLPWARVRAPLALVAPQGRRKPQPWPRVAPCHAAARSKR